MNTVVEKALTAHLALEFNSAYLYLSMSSWCEAENLPGFAHWFYVQYEEERLHAVKFFKFLQDRDVHVKLGTIETPQFSWTSPLNIMEETLKHEIMITNAIGSLLEIAQGEKDFATSAFLQWFINEQVEEEATVKNIIAHLKRIMNSQEGLFMMDRELGARALTIHASDIILGTAKA